MYNVSHIANARAVASFTLFINQCKNNYACAHTPAQPCPDSTIARYNRNIAYIDNVLAQFALTCNVPDLMQALVMQEHAVRKYYHSVILEAQRNYYLGEWGNFITPVQA